MGTLVPSEDSACAYSGGDMKFHHGYFGNSNTDENKVSTECVPEEAMQQKQQGALLWLAPVLVCLLLCACGCCCGILTVIRMAGRIEGLPEYALLLPPCQPLSP